MSPILTGIMLGLLCAIAICGVVSTLGILAIRDLLFGEVEAAACRREPSPDQRSHSSPSRADFQVVINHAPPAASAMEPRPDREPGYPGYR